MLSEPTKPVSILLVEDNPADAGLVRKALEEHGVKGRIIVLADGELATQFIQDLDARTVDCPDLVILDLNIPKKPGREVLEWLRRSVRGRRVPVVILSSSDARQDRADVAHLGADRYIRKPSDLEEFLSLGAVFKEMLCSSPR
jgi:DNA-binding response OmpR family regulator